MVNPISQQLDFSVACIRAAMSEAFNQSVMLLPVPKIAYVLGSAQGDLVNELDPSFSVAIPYDKIYGFALPNVEGHSGTLHIGTIGGVWVALLAGRPHYYEGNDHDAVVHPVRTMLRCGVKNLVLTNAAGYLTQFSAPGQIMIIRDHIDLFSGVRVCRGPNDASLGPRFSAPAGAHSKVLQELATQTCERLGILPPHGLCSGVYAMLNGPFYETAAEVKLLRVCGADAVGMSTTPEIRAAVHMGCTNILAMSLLTNIAGVADLDHGMIMAEVKPCAERMIKLLAALAPKIGELP